MQIKKVISFGLIHNPDTDQFLISQRYEPEVPGAHLKRDLIGGQNEFGESISDTCIREIKEETGLDVTIDQMLSGSYSQVWNLDGDRTMHVLIFCHACSIIGGELHIDDPKICDHKRISRAEFDHYDFLPSIQYFVSNFIDR